MGVPELLWGFHGFSSGFHRVVKVKSDGIIAAAAAAAAAAEGGPLYGQPGRLVVA